MSRKNKGGFTLIELLVVIAIIGILSAIVLASLSTARSKANDAKVQGQLSQIRAAAEIFSSNNGTNGYEGMAGASSTDASGLYTLEQANSYPGSVAPTIKDSITAWAASHILSDGTHYSCVDSTGVATSTKTANITTTNC